jgi:hypothetical protein
MFKFGGDSINHHTHIDHHLHDNKVLQSIHTGDVSNASVNIAIGNTNCSINQGVNQGPTVNNSTSGHSAGAHKTKQDAEASTSAEVPGLL